MSNIYKLQRYVNGSWVDVQLGQMNSVPVAQDTEDTPSEGSEGTTTTNTGTTLEQYLTLSQIQDQFVSTAVVRGNPSKQTLEHGLSAALGKYSIAFGDVATVGKGSVAFGGDLYENLEQIQVPGYWYVDRPENPEDWTEVFYMNIRDLDDVVTSTISTLEKLIIRTTVEERNYYLVITQVQPYQDEYYQFTFSQSQGDWEVFKTIIDGLVDNPNATHPSVNAQFTFISQIARGNNSFITGQSNITLGTNSSALGQGLKTTTHNQTVVGKYNKDSDALFVVGSGESYNRKNALEVGPDIFKFSGSSNQIYLKNQNVHFSDWTELTTPLPDKWRTTKQAYIVLQHNYQINGGASSGTYTQYKHAWITKPSTTSSGFDLSIVDWTLIDNYQYDYIKSEISGDSYYFFLLDETNASSDITLLKIVFDHKRNCVYPLCYRSSKKRWEVGIPFGSLTATIYYLN